MLTASTSRKTTQYAMQGYPETVQIKDGYVTNEAQLKLWFGSQAAIVCFSGA
jgi:hypothetical protein